MRVTNEKSGEAKLEALAKLAKLTALVLALWFTYHYTIDAATFDLHYGWKVFVFHLAQTTFFVGTVLIMISGLAMASYVLFGPGAVKVSLSILALGILMIVVTALEGNRMCATPKAPSDACDKEFARIYAQDEEWFSPSHIAKVGFIKAFETGVEKLIRPK
jgi:hypothetical protein